MIQLRGLIAEYLLYLALIIGAPAWSTATLQEFQSMLECIQEDM